MGLFQGNLNHTDRNFHLFTTNDKSLEFVGLSSFTQASVSGFIEENKDFLKVYFSNTVISEGQSTQDIDVSNAYRTLNSLTGNPSSTRTVDFQILAFNAETKKYEMKTGATDIFNNVDGGSGLIGLCKEHDDAEYGFLDAFPARKELVVSTIDNIQNSASGCLSFTPEFYVSGIRKTAEIKVFFQDKINRSNDRVVARRNDELYVGIPRTSAGGKYSWAQTSASNNIGTYSKLLEGGINNPKNTVAAPMRMSFNKSLGMWESGTQQMLARLLTDVDAATVPQLIPDLDTIDTLSSDALYDSDSANYMSQFAVGTAIPLCLENANPHMFGPNITSDGNNEKEKIRVVNRAPRTFKKHDVVMCSLIDSEWIIQGFDVPTIIPVETKISKWHFQKYIADSSVYFRDDRFATTNSPANLITPSFYESATRKKYYMSLANLDLDDNNIYSPSISVNIISDLKKLGSNTIVNDFLKLTLLNLNLGSTDSESAALTTTSFPRLSEYDFYPSSGYYQSTIFDNLGEHMGGLASANVISRTNVEVSPDGSSPTADAGDYEKLAGFWGPLFPDGYNASQVTDFKKNRSNNAKRKRSGLYFNLDNNFLSNADPVSLQSVTSTGINENMQRIASNYLFSDINDNNFKQLPAEVALNGSLYSSNGSPIENISNGLFALSRKGNLISKFYNVSNFNERYEWLAYEATTTPIGVSPTLSGIKPFYGFTPVRPNRIQFSPLQTEFSLNNAYLTIAEQTAKNIAEDDRLPFFKGANYFRKDILQDRFYNANLWGSKFFYRNDREGASPDETKPPHIKYGDKVPYPSSSNNPTGGPRIFPNVNGTEKSNVVGVIAAKVKFTTQPGATVNFVTSQYSGLTPTYQVAGGGGGSVGILNMGGGQAIVLQDPFTGAKQYSLKNWGSIGDSYTDFGTTALYVRIFDQWPDEQTIYDGRYFSVLHFNPDQLGYNVQSSVKDSGVVFNNPSWTPASGAPAVYERNVDTASSSVDFRIPTTCNPKTAGSDNKIIPAGTTITKDGVTGLDAALRKPSEWRVNPIRRGQLLTEGGFRYYKRVVGLVDPTNPTQLTIANGGMSYAIDDTIKFINNAKCRVTAIGQGGSVSSVSFIDADGNFTIGEGFTPEDFKTNLTQTSVTTERGSGLKIECTGAIVYDIIKKDTGPQDRLKDIRRLTLGSYMGEKEAAGELLTSLALENNITGKYEAFFHHHNDILYTVTQSQTVPTIGRFPQYVTLEIKAG
jgi:hypothetical protein